MGENKQGKYGSYLGGRLHLKIATEIIAFNIDVTHH